MGRPVFFEKNKLDLDLGTRVTITVTDAIATDNGQAFVNYLRDRKNDTGFATTGSTDAAGTLFEFDFGDLVTIDRLLLIGMNFKAYTAQYWNGVGWTAFSTPIVETVNTDTEKLHEFNSVEIERFRVQVNGTFVANDDKFWSQIIATEYVGEFVSFQPNIEDFVLGKNKRTIKMLSGKGKVTRHVGGAQMRIRKNNVTSDADLSLLETLHDYYDGFLVWPSGGDITDFPTQRRGWRKKDIFFMNIETELNASWEAGRYRWGMPVDPVLIEVI